MILPSLTGRFRPSSRSGAMLLVTVLITGAIALIVSISVAIGGIQELSMGAAEQGSTETLGIADGCMEEALLRLARNSYYHGGFLALGNGTCSIIVTEMLSVRTILVTATVDRWAKQLKALMNIDEFMLTHWEEDPDRYCGNGVIDPMELCDGDELDGKTCQGLGYDGGTLGCGATCLWDTFGCTGDGPSSSSSASSASSGGSAGSEGSGDGSGSSASSSSVACVSPSSVGSCIDNCLPDDCVDCYNTPDCVNGVGLWADNHTKQFCDDVYLPACQNQCQACSSSSSSSASSISSCYACSVGSFVICQCPGAGGIYEVACPSNGCASCLSSCASSSSISSPPTGSSAASAPPGPPPPPPPGP